MERIVQSFLVAVLALCVAGLVHAGEDEAVTPDGFYLLVEEDAGVPVPSPSGETLFLGDRVEFNILGGRIYSETNTNSRFSIHMNVPYDKKLAGARHVLVVDGIGYRQTGGGASREEISNLHVPVPGEEAAKAIGRFLDLPVRMRRHPGHQMLVEFIPTQEEFSMGEPIHVTLRIRNIGKTTFKFMRGGMNRAPRDNQYVFAAYSSTDFSRAVHDIGSTFNFGGLATLVTLKPGEVFEHTVDLENWFLFRESTYYSLFGSYQMTYYDPESDSWDDVMWQDIASAPFSIRISGQKKPDASPLTKHYQGKARFPRTLYATYAAFVEAAKTGDQEVLERICLPGAVLITPDGTPPPQPHSGSVIDLASMKEGFDGYILDIEWKDGSTVVIRTATSAVSFVGTMASGWRLHSYADKPMDKPVDGEE